MNVEELEGKQYPQGFETIEKTVEQCLTETVSGTGWRVIRCDVTKKRTVRIEQNCSAWDVAQQAITTYRCEIVFDSIRKEISIVVLPWSCLPVIMSPRLPARYLTDTAVGIV